MTGKLCLIFCEHLECEASAIIESEGFHDVTVMKLPTHCDVQQNTEVVTKIVAANKNRFDRIHIFGNSCIPESEQFSKRFERCRIHKMDQCFSYLVNSAIIDKYLKEGAHLSIPGSIKYWHCILEKSGFDKQVIRKFFGASVTKLILLDTGTDPKSADYLRELAGLVGIPFEILPVSLDFFRLYLVKIVLEWRLDCKSAQSRSSHDINRQPADYAVMCDFLSRLIKVTTEEEAIKNILNIYATLFAADRVVYLPFKAGKPGDIYSHPAGTVENEIVRNRLLNLREDYAWTGSGDGFLLRIAYQNEVVGILESTGFAFPEYKEQCLNLALILAKVCGLVIFHTRTYQLQQEEIIGHKLAEEKLRVAERNYSMLLENLPQRVFYKDRNLVYVSCNKNLARDLHINPNEITGKTDYDINPKELADKYRTDDKRIIESGRAEDIIEKYMKDGKECIAHTIKIPIKDEQGTIIGIMGSFIDISEKIILERESVIHRQLAALGELAAGIGHEINNPITGIINCAQILLNKSSEGSREKDLAGRIIKEGDRIAKIVHSLLFFAGSNSASEEKVPTSLYKIMSDVLILNDAQTRKDGIKIKCDISQELPSIFVHPQQIQQVFLNIISNARYALNQKYPGMHDDKILEILSEEVTIDGCSYLKIIFYDHGIGIPARIRDKIMDPFFTTKPHGIGTGLGLSISYGIIKDHGGKLIIESKEGEFTKIILLLPIKKQNKS